CARGDYYAMDYW
nr:immunoglobulin heavy chain junction region [Mus musculus]